MSHYRPFLWTRVLHSGPEPSGSSSSQSSVYCCSIAVSKSCKSEKACQIFLALAAHSLDALRRWRLTTSWCSSQLATVCFQKSCSDAGPPHDPGSGDELSRRRSRGVDRLKRDLSVDRAMPRGCNGTKKLCLFHMIGWRSGVQSPNHQNQNLFKTVAFEVRYAKSLQYCNLLLVMS